MKFFPEDPNTVTADYQYGPPGVSHEVQIVGSAATSSVTVGCYQPGSQSPELGPATVFMECATMTMKLITNLDGNEVSLSDLRDENWRSGVVVCRSCAKYDKCPFAWGKEGSKNETPNLGIDRAVESTLATYE